MIRANASHRAGRASHQVTLRCLGHSATIAFATTTATDWLLRAGPIAKRLNEQSQGDK